MTGQNWAIELMMKPPFPNVEGILDGDMVYIIHFSTHLAHAGHYVGYTSNLEQRLEAHRKGTSGARIMRVCKEQGIEWELAGVIPGDRALERALKNRKHIRAICPICRAAFLAERREQRRAGRGAHGNQD